MTGYAHHPYGRSAAAAAAVRPSSPARSGSSTSGRLKRVLDQAARAGRIPRRLPIFYTEHGFQTRPPEPVGVSLAARPSYMNQSDWIAFRDRRIRSVAQYKLVDDPDLGGFQTGLRFLSGARQARLHAPTGCRSGWPAAGARLTVYGQVRPAADGSRRAVEIQARRPPRRPVPDGEDGERAHAARPLHDHRCGRAAACSGCGGRA